MVVAIKRSFNLAEGCGAPLATFTLATAVRVGQCCSTCT